VAHVGKYFANYLIKLTFIIINYTYQMQVQITTSLPKSLVEQIALYGKENGKKKNQIIEESLSLFLMNEKKNHFINSFKRASLDKDIVNMAEEGLLDYKRQLKNY
jgi:hypothetical protein